MEGRRRLNSSAKSLPSKETQGLDVKPLRCLAPMFPAPLGFTTVAPPGDPPFICITPFGPSPSAFQSGGNPAAGFSPVFPSSAHHVGEASNANNGSLQYQFMSPSPQTPPEGGTKRKKAKRKRPGKPYDVDPLVLPSSSEDPRESVEVILMTFDALRRRILQVDEVNNVNKRPDLTAGAVMMDYGLRTNKDKRIGSVPGVDVGDVFYFRIEICLVGLHAPTMGGIDYMNTKIGDEDETLAVSIVSSGGYEDETDDADVLIYSGQGGGKANDGKKQQTDDQKLERGNLALERSLHRANEIRVIRGAKDPFIPNGKIYLYDGLYKIHASWVEKGKSGFNVFKYKLLREPGQPDAFAIWKMTEKWKENPSYRGRIILPDMSSGDETLPVCLVNEVDTEKGPSLFSYTTKVKYLIPLNSIKNLHACMCKNVCLPGDANCSCAQQNGEVLSYSSNGLLVSQKPLIYECSASCRCSVNCRNRVTQKGVKLHFEVFRTREKGWGLRSWDPIRAGAFICEYTGEVMDKDKANDDGEENEYIFEASHSDQKTFKWNYRPELLGEPSANDSGKICESLPIVVSAKNMGNVSRFMNHSCSPNVFWQPVQHDHSDECYPHIMFFAMKHIPPMTELTYDYGPSGRKVKCLCGSTNCRGFFG